MANILSNIYLTAYGLALSFLHALRWSVQFDNMLGVFSGALAEFN
jgi:hypothetical protein